MMMSSLKQDRIITRILIVFFVFLLFVQWQSTQHTGTTLVYANNINPYSVLGIPKNADKKTIKKAYRKLSMQYHPDRTRDETKKTQHQQKYMQINEAYEILKDDKKRKLYDRYGTTDPQQQSQQGFHFHTQHGFQDFGDVFESPFEFSSDIFEDLFESGDAFDFQFFGGGGRQQKRHRHQNRRRARYEDTLSKLDIPSFYALFNNHHKQSHILHLIVAYFPVRQYARQNDQHIQRMLSYMNQDSIQLDKKHNMVKVYKYASSGEDIPDVYSLPATLCILNGKMVQFNARFHASLSGFVKECMQQLLPTPIPAIQILPSQISKYLRLTSVGRVEIIRNHDDLDSFLTYDTEKQIYNNPGKVWILLSTSPTPSLLLRWLAQRYHRQIRIGFIPVNSRSHWALSSLTISYRDLPGVVSSTEEGELKWNPKVDKNRLYKMVHQLPSQVYISSSRSNLIDLCQKGRGNIRGCLFIVSPIMVKLMNNNCPKCDLDLQAHESFIDAVPSSMPVVLSDRYMDIISFFQSKSRGSQGKAHLPHVYYIDSHHNYFCEYNHGLNPSNLNQFFNRITTKQHCFPLSLERSPIFNMPTSSSGIYMILGQVILYSKYLCICLLVLCCCTPLCSAKSQEKEETKKNK